MTYRRVLLLASSPEELRPFLRQYRYRRLGSDLGPAWQVVGPDCQGIALLMGMGGPAPPAVAAQAMDRYGPDVVLLTGFGGALTAEPPPTGLVVAQSCWRLDPAGHTLRCQEFPAAVASVADVVTYLRGRGLPVFAGTLITTARVTAKASIRPLVEHLPAPVLDLETAAIAAVAEARHLPLLAVRAITDGAGEEIQDFLAQIINRHQGVPLTRLLPALAVQPHRLRYLFHLWGRSRRAALNLAHALDHILAYLARPDASAGIEGGV